MLWLHFLNNSFLSLSKEALNRKEITIIDFVKKSRTTQYANFFDTLNSYAIGNLHFLSGVIGFMIMLEIFARSLHDRDRLDHATWTGLFLPNVTSIFCY